MTLTAEAPRQNTSHKRVHPAIKCGMQSCSSHPLSLSLSVPHPSLLLSPLHAQGSLSEHEETRLSGHSHRTPAAVHSDDLLRTFATLQLTVPHVFKNTGEISSGGFTEGFYFLVYQQGIILLVLFARSMKCM